MMISRPDADVEDGREPVRAREAPIAGLMAGTLSDPDFPDPALPDPALSYPALSAPALVSPTLVSSTLGSSTLGSSTLSSPSLALGPLDPPGGALQVQRLLEQALEALKARDFDKALRLIDLRCRLPLARSAHFLMRADLRARLGYPGRSEDLALAYDLDPTEDANQRAFLADLAERNDPQALSRELSRLVRTEPDLPLLAEIFTRIGLSADRLFVGVISKAEGFTLWAFSGHRGTVNLTTKTQKGRARVRLPLARRPTRGSEPIYGGSVTLSHAKAGDFCIIEHEPSGAIVLNRFALARGATLPLEVPSEKPSSDPAPPDDAPHRANALVPAEPLARDAPPTPFEPLSPVPALKGIAPHQALLGRTQIIIPVYGDEQATRDCLQSLLDDDEIRETAELIVIDDACPLPRLKAWLAARAASGAIRLIENPFNLGFVGATNRVLAHLPIEETVLLNADTLLPKGWLGRLRAHAKTDPSIGTVTPLTHAGDFLSFPLPQAPRGPRAAREVEAIDQVFRQLFNRENLTIPTGIGYCLFITKACRQSLGLLDDRGFLKGYLEEVDYCLRARKLGFRHVAALDTYIGHVGSASFGATKRSYVVKNSAEILRRYPEHQREMEAFRLELPLQPYFSRAEAEILLFPARPRRALLIGGVDPESPFIEAAIKEARREEGEEPLLISFTIKEGWQIRRADRDPIRRIDGSDLMEGAPRDFPRRMARYGISRWHILDLARTPSALLEDCLARRVPFLLTLASLPAMTRAESLVQRQEGFGVEGGANGEGKEQEAAWLEEHPDRENPDPSTPDDQARDAADPAAQAPPGSSLISGETRRLARQAEGIILPKAALRVLAGDPILRLPGTRILPLPTMHPVHAPALTMARRLPGRRSRSGLKTGSGQLALVGAFETVRSYGRLKRMVQRLVGAGPWTGLCIIGPVLMPMDLLAAGPVTLFEERDWSEFASLALFHDIRMVAHLPTRLDFGTRPIFLRQALPCPEFDYVECVGRTDERPPHPRLLSSLDETDETLIARLSAWYAWHEAQRQNEASQIPAPPEVEAEGLDESALRAFSRSVEPETNEGSR